uniref:Cytochrome c oxidase subunit 7A1, mitochondrial n=1 Tax=Chelydra serpentina TaxID=8475 RepID=A0A8C3SZ66_CHESE
MAPERRQGLLASVWDLSSAAALSLAAGQAESQPPARSVLVRPGQRATGRGGQERRRRAKRREERRARPRPGTMQALLSSRMGSLRSFATATRHRMKNKVPEHQKLFQEDNDLPVHLKGGIVDAWLYRLTMTITVFGSCYSVFSLVKAAFPQKNK